MFLKLELLITMPYGRRYRRGRRGRFPKPVTIPNPAKIKKFIPEPTTTANTITIEPAELEALRLVDLEGLSQEQAGQKWEYHEEQSGDLSKVQEKK